MRIATWNVNSLKVRLPRVIEWIEYAEPDILCMQETKMADVDFPIMDFQQLGYEVAYHGNGRWNGVAILSRVGLSDSMAGFNPGGEDDAVERRLISAMCGGVRVISVYVPNGRSLDSEHYEAKLQWLEDLSEYLQKSYDQSTPLALCGDFNIAPEDKDVWDPKRFKSSTHVSDAERKALDKIKDAGLVDVFRQFYEESELFSWWDYRAGDFHKHHGLRIDLILLSKALAERASYSLIDRFARKGKLPSDHAPVLVDVDGQ